MKAARLLLPRRGGGYEDNSASSVIDHRGNRALGRGDGSRMGRRRLFDGKVSASQLEITCRAMLIQYERWFRALVKRSNRLDDPSCFREVIGDSHIPDPVIFTVNDFSAWRRSASGRLSDS